VRAEVSWVVRRKRRDAMKRKKMVLTSFP